MTHNTISIIRWWINTILCPFTWKCIYYIKAFRKLLLFGLYNKLLISKIAFVYNIYSLLYLIGLKVENTKPKGICNLVLCSITWCISWLDNRSIRRRWDCSSHRCHGLVYDQLKSSHVLDHHQSFSPCIQKYIQRNREATSILSSVRVKDVEWNSGAILNIFKAFRSSMYVELRKVESRSTKLLRK